MGASCNGCGSCCDPVLLPFNQAEAAADPNLDPYVKHWVTDILVPMRPKEAKAKEPFIYERPHVATKANEVIIFPYRCTWFDEERRVCANYEERPVGCRAYPWKNGVPIPSATLPPTCSFRADIGKPVEESWTDAPVHFVRKNRAK